MWVRQTRGRYAGEIIEMQSDTAKALLATGAVTEVTDEEIVAAGFDVAARNTPTNESQLVSQYTIKPSEDEEGGYDLLDPGGVKLNERPFRNIILANEAAQNYARMTLAIPPKGDPEPDQLTGTAVEPQKQNFAIPAGEGGTMDPAVAKEGDGAAGNTADDPDAPAGEEDLSKLSRKQLVELADKRKLELPPDVNTKAQIIEFLQANRA